MPKRRFAQYADGEEYQEQTPRPDSFRAGLYLHARRKGITAKSYVDHTTLPYPTVIFRIGAGPLGPLTGAPERGSKAHD